MTNFLSFCICCSLAITGIHIAINWPGMIFYWFGQMLNSYLCPECGRLAALLRKPLYQCTVCMASVWTTIFWWLLQPHFTWWLLFAIPVVAGINQLICAFIENFTEYGC